MQKFVTNLWFHHNAEEAAKFYVSLFENSKIMRVMHYSASAAKAADMKEGEVLAVEITLDGQWYTLINGGPAFTLDEAASIQVNCKDQAEIDELWDAITKDGGEESYCGWCKDKFGLSWQIVPEMMYDTELQKDEEAFERMMTVVYNTKGKLEIPKLEAAYKG